MKKDNLEHGEGIFSAKVSHLEHVNFPYALVHRLIHLPSSQIKIVLYLHYLSQVNQADEVKVSLATIAKRVGLVRRSVTRTIKDLEYESGDMTDIQPAWIKAERSDKKYLTKYTVNVPRKSAGEPIFSTYFFGIPAALFGVFGDDDSLAPLSVMKRATLLLTIKSALMAYANPESGYKFTRSEFLEDVKIGGRVIMALPLHADDIRRGLNELANLGWVKKAVENEGVGTEVCYQVTWDVQRNDTSNGRNDTSNGRNDTSDGRNDTSSKDSPLATYEMTPVTDEMTPVTDEMTPNIVLFSYVTLHNQMFFEVKGQNILFSNYGNIVPVPLEEIIAWVYEKASAKRDVDKLRFTFSLRKSAKRGIGIFIENNFQSGAGKLDITQFAYDWFSKKQDVVEGRLSLVSRSINEGLKVSCETSEGLFTVVCVNPKVIRVISEGQEIEFKTPEFLAGCSAVNTIKPVDNNMEDETYPKRGIFQACLSALAKEGVGSIKAVHLGAIDGGVEKEGVLKMDNKKVLFVSDDGERLVEIAGDVDLLAGFDVAKLWSKVGSVR